VDEAAEKAIDDFMKSPRTNARKSVLTSSLLSGRTSTSGLGATS
jgi:hypothetical protein